MIRNDTIAAIATPPGAGGVGIVRVSGRTAHGIALRCFNPESARPKQRVATLGRVIDSERGTVLDRCLLTLFSAPNSYTGEDVAEFSCHGSAPVLHRLLEIMVGEGARPAGPGEFTLRAVLNDRIDLTQAEAINRLVRSRTLLQAEEAVRQLEGAVSERVRVVDESLLQVVAQMEAAVDFADDDEEFIDADSARSRLCGIESNLDELIQDFGRADLLRDGAVVVIAGSANVGKSSLFNAILRRERSIVDREPGTTRDYIAETVDAGGMPLTLVDTAGLRRSGGRIEIEGMRRTKSQLGRADAVILVTESSRELTSEERSLLGRLRKRGKPTILAFNKSDLGIREFEEEGIFISAITGDGVTDLLDRIRSEVGIANGDMERSTGELITELRQQHLFREMLSYTQRAIGLLDGGAFAELVLEELNGALRSLGEITGEKTADDVLDRIFSQFCIGK